MELWATQSSGRCPCSYYQLDELQGPSHPKPFYDSVICTWAQTLKFKYRRESIVPYHPHMQGESMKRQEQNRVEARLFSRGSL